MNTLDLQEAEPAEKKPRTYLMTRNFLIGTGVALDTITATYGGWRLLRKDDGGAVSAADLKAQGSDGNGGLSSVILREGTQVQYTDLTEYKGEHFEKILAGQMQLVGDTDGFQTRSLTKIIKLQEMTPDFSNKFAKGFNPAVSDKLSENLSENKKVVFEKLVKMHKDALIAVFPKHRAFSIRKMLLRTNLLLKSKIYP